MQFNPYTGEFDLIGPMFTLDGKVELPMVTTATTMYSRPNGVVYFSIPINVVPPSVNIIGGQPIPIGMGLTQTYANNVN